ncbi:SprT-like family-domain-containing protein [Mariannaea sp. PMI_226]|nr:SprT-like family-domain-containing protein [Mariannaea sp. PMI_226]
MAFWVDRGRSSGRGPYFVGGKRRVSHSEGGDGFDYKRSRSRHDEFRTDEDYGSIPNLEEYNHCSDNRYAIPPNGQSSNYHPALGSCLRYPIDDDDRYPHDYVHDHDHDHDHDIDQTPPHQNAFPIRQFPPARNPSFNPPFFVLQERSSTPEFPPISPLSFGLGSAPGMGPVIAPPGFGASVPEASAMERTVSGLSVSSDTTRYSMASLGIEDDEAAHYVSDMEAARNVLDYVASRRRYPDSRHGRILKALINPKSRSDEADFTIDDPALRSIFSAANELFFGNSLTGRVTWDWSHPNSEQYHAHIVGTTAVRRRRSGGYETLIVLSSPILTDTKYNRRLLISTFLHEMIHSYLFVVCGIKAGQDGGHTQGFRQIAEEIDNWVGPGHLRLGEMEADLEQFRKYNHIHDYGRDYERGSRSVSMDGERRVRERSPHYRWDEHLDEQRSERDGHSFYPIEPRPLPPQQQQHYQRELQQQPGYHGWQWPEEDRFCSHGPRGVGPSYV